MSNPIQCSQKPKKVIEEKIPVDTEKIIKEAEDTLVLKKEVKKKRKYS